jgi:hypothetical protein
MTLDGLNIPLLPPGEFFEVERGYVTIYTEDERLIDRYWSNYEIAEQLPKVRVKTRTQTNSWFERLASFWQLPKTYTQWRSETATAVSIYGLKALGRTENIGAESVQAVLNTAAKLRWAEVKDTNAFGVYVPTA